MSMQTTSDNTRRTDDGNQHDAVDRRHVGALIMLIITIPPQTHAVKLDLPQQTECSAAAG